MMERLPKFRAHWVPIDDRTIGVDVRCGEYGADGGQLLVIAAGFQRPGQGCLSGPGQGCLNAGLSAMQIDLIRLFGEQLGQKRRRADENGQTGRGRDKNEPMKTPRLLRPTGFGDQVVVDTVDGVSQGFVFQNVIPSFLKYSASLFLVRKRRDLTLLSLIPKRSASCATESQYQYRRRKTFLASRLDARRKSLMH